MKKKQSIKKNKLVVVTAFIPEKTRMALRKHSYISGKSMKHIINEAIEWYLENESDFEGSFG